MADTNRKDKGLLFATLLLAIGILLIFFPFNILNGLTIWKFKIDTEEYNKLGDFITGISSPFISISAFILLYKTYKSQTEELIQTRSVLATQSKILDKQQFETTFFNLVNLYK